jgi:hypothetical protein
MVLLDENHSQLARCREDSLMAKHWAAEDSQFEEELDRWNEFRRHQEIRRQYRHRISWLWDRDTFEELSYTLTKLNEWREFEAFQRMNVSRAKLSTEHTRSQMEWARQHDVDFRSRHLGGHWRRRVIDERSDADRAQNYLSWVRHEFDEILKEEAMVTHAPILQQELEKKLMTQAHNVYQDLVRLGGTHCNPLQLPPEWKSHSRRLLALNSETTRLLEERWQWKEFLTWRQDTWEMKGTAMVKTHVYIEQKAKLTWEAYISGDNGKSQERSQAKTRLEVELWEDYVIYRHLNVEKAHSWADCQRLIWEHAQEQLMHFPASKMVNEYEEITYAEDEVNARKWMEVAQEDIIVVEKQLELAQQQLAHVYEQRSRKVSEQQGTMEQPTSTTSTAAPQAQAPVPLKRKASESTETCQIAATQQRGDSQKPLAYNDLQQAEIIRDEAAFGVAHSPIPSSLPDIVGPSSGASAQGHVVYAKTHPPLTSDHDVNLGSSKPKVPSSPLCQSETLGVSNEEFCKGALMTEEQLATIATALSPTRTQGPLLDHVASKTTSSSLSSSHQLDLTNTKKRSTSRHLKTLHPDKIVEGHRKRKSDDSEQTEPSSKKLKLAVNLGEHIDLKKIGSDTETQTPAKTVARVSLGDKVKARVDCLGPGSQKGRSDEANTDGPPTKRLKLSFSTCNNEEDLNEEQHSQQEESVASEHEVYVQSQDPTSSREGSISRKKRDIEEAKEVNQRTGMAKHGRQETEQNGTCHTQLQSAVSSNNTHSQLSVILPGPQGLQITGAARKPPEPTIFENNPTIPASLRRSERIKQKSTSTTKNNLAPGLKQTSRIGKLKQRSR